MSLSFFACKTAADHTFRVAAGVRSNHKTRGVGLEFVNVSLRCARYIRELIAELEAKKA